MHIKFKYVSASDDDDAAAKINKYIDEHSEIRGVQLVKSTRGLILSLYTFLITYTEK